MTAKETLLMYLFKPEATVGRARKLVLEVIAETKENCAQVADEEAENQMKLKNLYGVAPCEAIAADIRKREGI